VIAGLGLSADDYAPISRATARATTTALTRSCDDHVFGVPIFLYGGEPFWGHDRLPVLEQRLTEAGLGL